MINRIEKEIETLKSIRDKMMEDKEYGPVAAISGHIINLMYFKRDIGLKGE